MNVGQAKQLAIDSVRRFREDRGAVLAAAIAFNVIFAVVPMVMVVLAVGDAVLGEQAATRLVGTSLAHLVGVEFAGLTRDVVRTARRTESVSGATALGIGLVLWGAGRLFAHLRESLDIIWRVRPRIDGFSRVVGYIVLRRAIGVVITLAIGLLLVLFLLANVVLSRVGADASWLTRLPWPILRALQALASTVVLTAVFAAVFRTAPDTRLHMRDVTVGACVTAVLVVLGDLVLGYWLARRVGASAYGLMTGAMVVLLWVYYSAGIFLLGAEFTCLYAERAGRGVHPVSYARRVTETELEPG